MRRISVESTLVVASSLRLPSVASAVKNENGRADQRVGSCTVCYVLPIKPHISRQISKLLARILPVICASACHRTMHLC